jgi:hypothetical protein
LGNPVRKKEEEEELTPKDTPVDREESLSLNFSDPELQLIVLGADDENPPSSLLQETADAVHELVIDGAEPPASGEPDPSALLMGVDGEPNTKDFNLLFGGDMASDFAAARGDASPFAPAAHGLSPPVAKPGVAVPPPAPASMAHEVSGVPSFAPWIMAKDLFQLVACEKGFGELVEESLRAIMRSVNAKAGAVLELDYEKNEFFFRASLGGGDPSLVSAFRVPCNKGIVGHVAETGQPLLLTDLESDDLQMKAISMSTGFAPKSCMAAPILVAGQLFGVVEVFNEKLESAFNEQCLETLNEGARMMAKLLEVRFLTAELVRRLR